MKRRYLSLVLAAVLVTGCVTSSVEQIQIRPMASAPSSDESVVVLGREHGSQHQTEADFSSCVAGRLRSKGLTIHPAEDFRDALFPWFEPRTAPLTTGRLPQLFSDQVVVDRLRRTGVRYVVWLDGITRDGDSEGGSMSCALSPAGGGCFGFVYWEKESAYEAALWDLQEMDVVGKVKLDASGTSYIPAVIVPLPFIARPQAAACGDMADQVNRIIRPAGG